MSILSAITVSMPEPQLMESLARSRALILSLPEPPLIASLPEPPVILSAPVPPVILSLPLKPLIESLPPLPQMTSPPEVPCRTSPPSVPLMVQPSLTVMVTVAVLLSSVPSLAGQCLECCGFGFSIAWRASILR